MAFLSLTKKAASALKIDIRQVVAHKLTLPILEEWIVDIILPYKPDSPGILFYNKTTGFVITLNPAEYRLEYCLSLVRQQLARFLVDHGFEDKLFYFIELFSIIHLCRNDDRSAAGYISQSKSQANHLLEDNSEHRVDNSYDLMLCINQNYRKIKGIFSRSRTDDFLIAIGKINKDSGITMHCN